MTSMFRDRLFEGRRILVTGGGTGLGREMVEAYLKLGADVFICGRRKGVLDDTAAELTDRHGGRVTTFGVDIRDAEAVDEMIGAIWEEGGPLTGLVNNAAGNFISPTKDLSSGGFDAIANIVLHGTFYVTHAVGRRWIDDGVPGHVISIVVTWVWNGSAFVVPSAMAKAGVHIMTRSLAVEWAPHGIRLNAIAPGSFPTKGATERLRPEGLEDLYPSAESVPMGRTGRMDELTSLATFLMADGCDYLTGQTIAIDGAAHLVGAGQFYHLSSLSDGDWEKMRTAIRAADEKDRESRNV